MASAWEAREREPLEPAAALTEETDAQEGRAPTRRCVIGISHTATSVLVFVGACAAALAACALLWGPRNLRGSLSGAGRTAAVQDSIGLIDDPTLQSSHRQIRWKVHPHKCLDVWGHSGAGSVLQLWTCNDYAGAEVTQEAEFQFIIPAPNVPGTIRWAGDSSLCLNAPKGPDGNSVELTHCDKAPVQHTRWKITSDGRIRLAYHLDKCLDIPDGHKTIANGIKLQLSDCMEGHETMEGNVLFDVFPQNCEWSTWSEWSLCSVSCGGDGHRYQARRFQVEAANGGEACEGSSTRSETCGDWDCDHVPPATPSPTTAPLKLEEKSCYHKDYKREPGMPGEERTVEESKEDCKARCARTEKCVYYTFWPDGGCWLGDETATEWPADGVYTGMGVCKVGACYDKGYKREPNMQGESRTDEATNEDCQARCAATAGCTYFSWWPDGGCWLQDSGARKWPQSGVFTGPAVCKEGATTEVQAKQR